MPAFSDHESEVSSHDLLGPYQTAVSDKFYLNIFSGLYAEYTAAMNSKNPEEAMARAKRLFSDEERYIPFPARFSSFKSFQDTMLAFQALHGSVFKLLPTEFLVDEETGAVNPCSDHSLTSGQVRRVWLYSCAHSGHPPKDGASSDICLCPLTLTLIRPFLSEETVYCQIGQARPGRVGGRNMFAYHNHLPPRYLRPSTVPKHTKAWREQANVRVHWCLLSEEQQFSLVELGLAIITRRHQLSFRHSGEDWDEVLAWIESNVISKWEKLVKRPGSKYEMIAEVCCLLHPSVP